MFNQQGLDVNKLIYINAVATDGTSSCTPIDCQASCSPSCGSDYTCVLKTMTKCGVCPASACLSRTSLGLPPLKSTTSQPSSSNSSNGTGVLVGGIVGGLVGLGLVVSAGLFFYFKKSKPKKGQLPFAFTTGNASQMISQTPQRALSPPDTPTQPRHPSLLPSSRSSLRYMASVSSAGRTGSIISSGRMNYNDGPIVFNNSFNDFNTTNTTPSSSSPTAFANSMIPEEFEESIALQNKRISQILHNNPRMSQRSSYNRNSALSYATSTDDSHYDGDKRDSTSTTSSRARDSQPTQPQVATAVQVVQVTRAKPQIMRVNSVRQSVMSNGLSRSNSVRTILTPASESEINLPSPSSGTTDELNKKEKIVEEDEGEYDNVSIDQFPSTSDNPFNDTHASSSSAEDSTKKKH